MKFLVENLETITSEELVQITPFLKKLFETNDLSRHSDNIIKALSSLKIKHTYNFMKNIDGNFPGLSFRYIMEARHNMTKENLILLYRVAYYLTFEPEQKIFSPIRERLIRGLIADINEDDAEIFNFKHNISKLSQTFLSIDSLDVFSLKQKNKLKISLFDKYINQLINKHFEK